MEDYYIAYLCTFVYPFFDNHTNFSCYQKQRWLKNSQPTQIVTYPLKLAKTWSKELEKYDVIIGKIADDKMMDSIIRFSDNEITDETLKACLLSVNHGLQYVAKTDFACSKIEVLEEKQLFGLELESARNQAAQRRIDGVKLVNQAINKTRGSGKYLDDIIKEQRKIEKKVGGNDEH